MAATFEQEPTGIAAELIDEQTPFRRFLSDFCSNHMAVAALATFAVIACIAIAAPLVSPQNPYDLAELNLLDGRLSPGAKASAGFTHWLGTDDQGRDILSGIFFGLRTSLGVGALSAVLALMLGASIGLIGAYVGGKADSIIMRLADIQLSFPPILVALILLVVLGQGAGKIVIALVAVQWAYYARTVRSSALVEKRKEYIEAAQCLALSHARIVFSHLLPNCLPPLIVVVTVQVAHSIALEATLSFLGIGLPVTEPSLGLMIANGFEYMLSGRYWISFFPGLALLITIVSINLVGDHLRDILNPRLQR